MNTKGLVILLIAGCVIALPFIFRRPQEAGDWKPDDPVLVIITPHNEAIRHEFARGFSQWHQTHYGKPVKIDWRIIGGTTEIMRYLASEYEASAGQAIRNAARKGITLTREAAMRQDAPDAVTCRIDLFFGGGTYDHGKAERQGLTVPAWETPPPGLFTDEDGAPLIPERLSGEVWCGKAFYGNVLSTFGICYNTDRLRDLSITKPPASWDDLTAPQYAGQVGVADPTKSGSVAKAFEMMIHAACAKRVAAAGFTRSQIDAFEKGETEPPPAYQAAIEAGWADGIRLVRRIGANARYFTDSAGKVPVDVSSGVTAAGIAIDFFGRLQSELAAKRPDGSSVMGYVTPVGGSSVSADPISLLRGAPHRELAVRFITFVLGPDGQKLWNYRVGEPGGPDRFDLRRLPIRRDFYPSADPERNKRFLAHQPHLTDPLGDPDCDVYRLAESFVYYPRWTSRHFGIQRDLIRALCMDSGDELHAAWSAILAHGGPDKQPEAMRLLEALPDDPEPMTWQTILSVYNEIPRLERLRRWTDFFRKQYDAARKAVR